MGGRRQRSVFVDNAVPYLYCICTIVSSDDFTVNNWTVSIESKEPKERSRFVFCIIGGGEKGKVRSLVSRYMVTHGYT